MAGEGLVVILLVGTVAGLVLPVLIWDPIQGPLTNIVAGIAGAMGAAIFWGWLGLTRVGLPGQLFATVVGSAAAIVFMNRDAVAVRLRRRVF